MEESAKSESYLSSAATFMEGGIQEVCDDSCSICLEGFTNSDPSTLTSCKHEFHLQCILEWCQRSSQCPMCWQPISFKDPTSQELLEAVEKERTIRSTPQQRTAVFHHPILGDFEFQLPLGENGAELEEHIFNHLAAAAAMGRIHQMSTREGHRNRSAARGRQQFTHNSAHADSSSMRSASRSAERGGDLQGSMLVVGEEATRANVDQPRRRVGVPTAANEVGAGPSDLQSFSETLKSRWNAISSRYKESISKSTRGWKERLFSRNPSTGMLGSDVRGEGNTRTTTISHMMEHLNTSESAGARIPSTSNGAGRILANGSIHSDLPAATSDPN